MYIPSMLLKRLYTFGSLKNLPDGVQFSVKNRLSDARLTGITHIKINGKTVQPEKLSLDSGMARASRRVRSPRRTRSPSPCARPSLS